MIWDHNKDLIVNWAKVILGDANAAKYAWGVAYHRYAGDLFDSLSATHDAFPNTPMVATECSVRDTWAEAERMAHEIIGRPQPLVGRLFNVEPHHRPSGRPLS